MANTFQITVPDIGNFDSVEVIDVIVKIGDTIKKEDSLITVESDKASMDIPSTHEGKVTAINLKVGDKIKQGSNILVIELSASSDKPEKAENKTEIKSEVKVEVKKEVPTETIAKKSNLTSTHETEVVVLGSGPGGYTAAFRAADLGKKVVLIERYSTLGGVCLNVGCIPSKALLHTAKVITDAEETAAHGVTFGEPHIDLEKIDLAQLPELEQFMLHKIYSLNENFKNYFKNYDFHNLYKELLNFCNVALSAFYFDIRKDTLYCDELDSQKRKSTIILLNLDNLN